MKTYQEIIESNTLPTISELKDAIAQNNLLGYDIKLIDGYIKTPDILLYDKSLEEFIEILKEFNVKYLYLYADPYGLDEVLISDEDFKSELIKKFSATLIYDYKSQFSAGEQLDYFLEKVEESYLSVFPDIYNKEDTDKNQDKIEDFITLESMNESIEESDDIDEYEDDIDDFDDTDDSLYDEEITLTKLGMKLLNDIENFNANIPKDIFNIVKILQLTCVIDNKFISLQINNDIEFNHTIQLANILSSYTDDYKKNVLKIKDIIKKRQEETIKKEHVHRESIHTITEQILNDNNFIMIPNDTMRISFIKDVLSGDNKNYSYKVVKLAYPEIDEGPITKAKLTEILQDIKYLAMSYGIKLGKK